jgi:hypothetical protein
MGMFDSVWHKCECGGDVEWQSKAGECSLAGYEPSSVPEAVAYDLLNETAACRSCGKPYRLIIPMAPPPDTVAMYAVPL